MEQILHCQSESTSHEAGDRLYIANVDFESKSLEELDFEDDLWLTPREEEDLNNKYIITRPR